MKKAWYRTSELVGIAGLPNNRQGVTKRSRMENWRRRRLKGVQGRGLEFAFDSLPLAVQEALSQPQPQLREPDEAYQAYKSGSVPDPISAWMAIYGQLTPQERDEVIALLLREGIAGFLTRLGLTPKQA